jgi:Flp pilus assembly protein TadD
MKPKFSKGLALEKAGKPDEALRAYYAALETAPGLVEARQNVGTIYYEQKQYDKAEREFRLFFLKIASA